MRCQWKRFVSRWKLSLATLFIMGSLNLSVRVFPPDDDAIEIVLVPRADSIGSESRVDCRACHETLRGPRLPARGDETVERAIDFKDPLPVSREQRSRWDEVL